MENHPNKGDICDIHGKDYIPISTRISPTEMRNPRSGNLATLATSEAIRLMVEEESSALKSILLHEKTLSQLIDRIVETFRNGGRMFYVGAGTSGRLGVIDASECHSTFSTPLDLVQGIIAGDTRALYEPFDCAEETFKGGVVALQKKHPSEKDVVIGISASGQTPFLWGSLYSARSVSAFVALITFNPFLEFKLKPDLVISLDVGPEVLTGSTRLKCGTTTKCILNMISTLSMVQMGKCYENLMIDLNPVNSKLKERAVRILVSLRLNLWTPQEIEECLERNQYNMKKTIVEMRPSQINGSN